MAAERCKLVLYMLTTLLGSYWLHMSKYVMLVAKLGVCSSHGH